MERFKFPVSVHLFLRSDCEILLHLRKNSSFEGMYGVIAGHVDGGERVTDAVVREAKEEAGIDIKKNDLSFIGVSHSNANNNEYIQFFFSCEKWSGKIDNLEKNKCGELRFFDINKLPKNMVPYIKDAIKDCYNNRLFFENGWDSNK